MSILVPGSSAFLGLVLIPTPPKKSKRMEIQETNQIEILPLVTTYKDFTLLSVSFHD